MFRKSAVAVLIVVASLLATGQVALARAGRPTFAAAAAGIQVPVFASTTSRQPTPIQAPAGAARTDSAGAAVVATTADIEVTYSGFSAAAQAAFQAAVDIWSTQVVSSQVIHISASWSSLGNTGILGEAGPSRFYLGGDHLMYAAALAEAMCSCELQSSAEITAAFNSDFSAWYLGTDGQAPLNKWDFETVVLHELGHGLGFLSTFSVNSTTGKGKFGISSGGTLYPTLFDTDEWSAATGGSQMTSFTNPSTTLATQLTDGSVYFDGTNVEAVLGHRAKLYAPSSWQAGSSNAHLDEAAFPQGNVNALMTPQLANGEVIHDPGPLTLAMLHDLGWTTSDSLVPPTAPDAPQNVTAAAGNASADVAWNAPASNGGSPITGYTVTSDPDGQTCATAGPTGCTVAGLTNGTPYTFTVTATNDVGTGPASDPSAPVTPSELAADTTPPVVSPPALTLLAGQQLGKKATVQLAWPDATDVSGIAAYELQIRKGSGSWQSVSLGSATDTAVELALKPGATYRFRLRATDSADNTSAWLTTTAARLRLVQEKSATIAYTGTWKGHALAGASGGYVRSAGAAGRRATFTFNGSSGAVVSTLGPNRGIVDVWLDGAYVESIDLYAPNLTAAAVVWATDAGLAAGTHTIELRATGTHNAGATRSRVDVDAFLAWP